jgi:hypothetical protein
MPLPVDSTLGFNDPAAFGYTDPEFDFPSRGGPSTMVHSTEDYSRLLQGTSVSMHSSTANKNSAADPSLPDAQYISAFEQWDWQWRNATSQENLNAPRVHGEDLSSQQPPPTPNLARFRCEMCDEPFSHKRDLVRHRGDRHKLATTMYICEKPSCGAVFIRRDKMREHCTAKKDAGCIGHTPSKWMVVPEELTASTHNAGSLMWRCGVADCDFTYTQPSDLSSPCAQRNGMPHLFVMWRKVDGFQFRDRPADD